MAQAEIELEGATTKKSKRPMLIGMVLAVLMGAGGFFAVWSGAVLGPASDHSGDEGSNSDFPLPDVVFVPIQPLMINLGRDGSNRYLRFQAQLEVTKDAEEEVTLLLPRVTDVLNSYLRAVSAVELEDPTALVRLRAQMLRRVQVVTGPGRIRDLLIMEFVLN